MMFDGGFGDREWVVEEAVLRQVDQCRNGLSSLLRRKAGPMTIRANKVTVYVYRAEVSTAYTCAATHMYGHA